MNAVFCTMLLVGVIAAAAQGGLSAAQDALLGVLRESGVTAALAGALRRPLVRLFPFAPGEEQALDDICVNLAADMLGMGGAATPAGLSAMRKMAASGRRDGRASDAMLLFLTLNMCSVQLLPTTMIAIRAQAGAQSPADIVLPTLLATGVQTMTGIILCKALAARSKAHD